MTDFTAGKYSKFTKELMLVLCFVFIGCGSGDSEIIKDRNLEKAVRKALGNKKGPLQISDLHEIKEIGCLGVSDLSGIQHMKNLESVHFPGPYFFGGRISDLSPLSELKKLRHLRITAAEVSDLTSLSGVVSLKSLDLPRNKIHDVSPLKNLTNLEELFLYQNDISDISPLLHLPNLRVLDVSSNNISIIPDFSGSSNLEDLGLFGNKIDDNSNLESFSGIEYVNLGENRIKRCDWLIQLTSDPNMGRIMVHDNPIECPTDDPTLIMLQNANRINLNKGTRHKWFWEDD